MAELFRKQGKEYADGRPSYPSELFHFIASKTSDHLLAWDVGTGNGQAAVSLAGIFDRVVATDTSPEQLEFAPKLPNVRYQRTSPAISKQEFELCVSPPASVDAITVAQALHWFANQDFFALVEHALKPNGVFAAWCYALPVIGERVDRVLLELYDELAPFWSPERRMVDEEYRSIEFPFEPVAGEETTGPFRFEMVRTIDLDSFKTYLKSWSAYNTAKAKGVELLNDEVIRKLEEAWGDGGKGLKVATYPIFLKIGKPKGC